MNAYSYYNPEMLAKIRSEALMAAINGMPCTLRIAGFIPGHQCSPRDTVVGCHLDTIGKGKSTKVSDLFVAAGCMHCHRLLDRVDNRWFWLMDNYPAAVMQRQLNALCETQSLLLSAGIIVVPKAQVI